jgi:prepilin-type processing-associated H-X9-DG protein
MKRLQKNSSHALSRVEVLVIIVVIGLLACWLFPAIRNAKARDQRIGCVSNLKQIGTSFKVWAADDYGQYPMQVSITNGGTMELVPKGNIFPIFQVMSNELNSPIVLVCPADTQRSPAASFTNGFNEGNVSYFVSLDASDSMPQMFVSGDRNLSTNGVAVRPGILTLTKNQTLGWTEEIHKGAGNILMADGSVPTFNSQMLKEALRKTGVATNRLAMP